MAEPSILGALRDPQFRSDTLRNLVEALNGAKRSLTVGSLGAVGDMGNTLANLVRAGAGTAYHETTGRPIPQALEYRDPARDFGTSASLGNFAERQGWLPPQTGSIPETAGALLGPIVAMKAPDLAQSTLRGLVSALKSEPSRRMVDNLVDATGARFNAVPKPEYGIDHRPMTVEGGASQLHDLTPAFGEDIYGPNALQFFGSGDPREKAVVGLLKKIRGNPDAMVTVYRGVPADAPQVINPGDWVTLDKNAAADYGRVVEMKVPASHVTSWADSLLEFGYHPLERNGKPVSRSRPMKVRPAKERLVDVADSNFDIGIPQGDKTVNINSLVGRMSSAADDAQKVDALAKQMASDGGYIERLIVDQFGNVIEGQHRLNALRKLGVKDVPVSVINDYSSTFEMLTKSGMRPEHARNVVQHSAEMLKDSGTAAKVLEEYELPRGYEDAFRAALKHMSEQ